MQTQEGKITNELITKTITPGQRKKKFNSSLRSELSCWEATFRQP